MRLRQESLSSPSLTERQVTEASPHQLRVFAVLLLLSGLCGISYEILYARLLGNLVGDQFAVSTSILMTFLFGIGVGTRFAHRLWKHLWLIEAAIGYCSIAFAVGTEQLDRWLYATLPVFGGGLGSSVLLCSILLSAPAFLIGCSLPLFAGYLSRIQPGRVFSKAYMLYNFGAALTALLIEFWILRAVGLRWALVSIASVNIFVSVVLWSQFGHLRASPPQRLERISFHWNDKVGLALVSMASAIFQLMMIKTAECLVGPFHETFALVLAIVLLGIAAGSAVSEKYRLGFGAIVAMNLLGLAWFLGGLEFSVRLYADSYPVAAESYLHCVLLKFGTLGLIMGIPALTFGATIPALLTVQRDVARESGELLFISSVANAFGFLFMAFVLHRAFDYGVITLIIAGFTGLGLVVWSRFRFRSMAIAATLFMLVVGVHWKVWDEDLLYLGHTSFHSTEDLEEAREDLSLPEKYRGYQDIFAINWIDDKPYFFINGYLSISLNSPSEKIVGAFSSIFAPRSDRALVLGVGSGATAGTVSQMFDHTDAVEINPAVLANLYRMKDYNFDIENNPRITIVQDDAIHYTKASDNKYSLVINTVTTPLYFSSSKLYTHEFLRQVRERLKPGGVYVTWVDSRIGDQGLDIVLNTVSQSFEYCGIGCVKASYLLLLCSDKPIRPHQPRIVANTPILNDYFLMKHDLNPAWFSYGLLTDDAFGLIDDAAAPVNTLDYPALEFTMTRLRKRGIGKFKRRLRSGMSLATSEAALRPEIAWDPYQLLMHTRQLLGRSTITDRWEKLITSRYGRSDRRFQRAELDYFAALAHSVNTAEAHHKYGYRLMRFGRYEQAIREFQIALKINPHRDNSYFNLGACLERMNRFEGAIDAYRQELAVDPHDSDVPYRVSRVLLTLGRFEESLAVLGEFERIGNHSKVHLLRGRALEKLGRHSEALNAFQSAVATDPENEEANKELHRLQNLEKTRSKFSRPTR